MVNSTRCLQDSAHIVHIPRFAAIRSRFPSLAGAVRTGFLAGILTFVLCPQASSQDRQPTEKLSPQEVVRIVITSLKDNDAQSDAGIARVFSLASPANRLSTGPLSRFTTMIKKGFPDMLNHSSARYDPMEIDANTAVQAVWLMTPSGAEVGYAFQLSRQVDGEYEGMWMTDMVIPLGKGPGSGTRI